MFTKLSNSHKKNLQTNFLVCRLLNSFTIFISSLQKFSLKPFLLHVDQVLGLIFCTQQMKASLEYNPFLKNLVDHWHLLVYVPSLLQIAESKPLMSSESPPVK